jgi:hypothetical protein
VYTKAAHWLRKKSWRSLFLSLPVEAEPIIYDFVKKKIDEIEFWKDYTLLTGLANPFINSLKLKIHPILRSLKDIYTEDREIHCYRDLKAIIYEKEILEQILLLELKCLLSDHINLENWRKTLFHEMNVLKDSWKRAVERILSEVTSDTSHVILFDGYLKSIEPLKRTNNKINIILLESYWKSPLDILRTVGWKHGFLNIPNITFERYIKLQKKYLDLIITLHDVDEAHQAWSQMIQKKHYLTNSDSPFTH